MNNKSWKHGHRPWKGPDSPTYKSWRAMKERVKPNAHVAQWYADRGITVCEQWRDFRKFLADMGERPGGTTLDRIDTGGNYEPTNCRWATKEEQALNRRPRKHCSKGHLFAEAGQMANGRCMRCHRDYMRDYMRQQRKKAKVKTND